MKISLLFILTTFLSFNSFSQINFEKGYFIDNANVKTECLIKNMDWNSNPIEFEYKTSETEDTKIANIRSVKEFSINNVSKYIRSTVDIDRSSEVIRNMSRDKNAVFAKEELFLDVLVEGEATLYGYTDEGLKRYFIGKKDSGIEQLVFKEYLSFDNKTIGKNNQYKQQLVNNLKCPQITLKDIEDLEYKRKDLVDIFAIYNNCNGSNTTNYVEKRDRDLINISLRPRINSSSLTSDTPLTNSTEIEVDPQLGFGFGIEFEYIFPFNKNKWSLAVEPTYQSFKSEGTESVNNVSGGSLKSKVDYTSLEIPISARHHFFLNDNSKLYLGLAYIIDLPFDSSIAYTRADGSIYDTLDINTGRSYGLSLGYKYLDKYNLEIRYQTDREVLTKYTTFSSKFNSISLIFGYSIF